VEFLQRITRRVGGLSGFHREAPSIVRRLFRVATRRRCDPVGVGVPRNTLLLVRSLQRPPRPSPSPEGSSGFSHSGVHPTTRIPWVSPQEGLWRARPLQLAWIGVDPLWRRSGRKSPCVLATASLGLTRPPRVCFSPLRRLCIPSKLPFQSGRRPIARGQSAVTGPSWFPSWFARDLRGPSRPCRLGVDSPLAASL
jgi:hypothetical protein